MVIDIKTSTMSQPTPVYSHIKSTGYRDVYEPAEDSFLLMDALELETSFINELKYQLASHFPSLLFPTGLDQLSA